MATNKIADANIQEWTVASKSSGDPVILEKMTGVCLGDTDATSGKVVVDTEGIYDLSVKAINDAGNVAVADGDMIFYVVGDTPVLSKKASGVFFGYAREAIATGTTATINVDQIKGPGPGTADVPDGSVSLAKLATGITPSHVVKFAGEVTWTGGGASLATTVTGALATDIVIASIQTVPSEAGYLVSCAVTNDTVTTTLSADNTTNDAVISYMILRAVA